MTNNENDKCHLIPMLIKVAEEDVDRVAEKANFSIPNNRSATLTHHNQNSLGLRTVPCKYTA